MRKIDLIGEWTVRKSGTKKSLPALVPGCIHADLLSATEINNPLLLKNLETVAWVLADEWVYEKLFVAEDLTPFECLVLRFEGVSAGAVIALNDVVLGQVTNVFETAEFDVKTHVKTGKNKLTVTFPPEVEFSKDKNSRRQASVCGIAEQPSSPTVGLFRVVALMAFKAVRVKDVLFRQDFSGNGVVGLAVDVVSERFDPELHLEVLVRVCYKGNILHEARDILSAARTALHLTIKNPQLWWPAGLGDQPLYEVTVDVLAGRTCLEHVSRRIGLRQFTVEHPKEGGKACYRFFVNGHPMVLKGASWLPADLYVARSTRVEYARIVKAAAVANMNTLRVWGGGVYENDAFYDLCDEYGICIWQDLMLCEAQSEMPTAWQLAAFGRELDQNVQRLRHHSCLMLWCLGDGGGSGIAVDYLKFAAEQLAVADPERTCLSAIPHSPFSLGGDNGYEPLSSYPEPRVVSGYLGEEDRNVSHPVCMFHTVPAEGPKRMYSAFLQNFLLPAGFENTLWLSQIQHGVAVKAQFERLRMEEALPSGFLYWHLNDGWPVCSSASLDYEGRWKALHYMTRRFFAPLWLCGEYRAELGCVDVFTFDDGTKPFKGEVQWRLLHMEGTVVSEGSKKVSMQPASREKLASIKVADSVRKTGAGNLMMWLYLLDEKGNQVAWNFVLFCSPCQLALQQPRMRAEIRTWDDNNFAVTLTSHRPALWVWITLEGMDARYEDNFFCLEPEKPVRIRITPSSRIKLDHFRQIIRIGSLRDTWQEKRTLMQMMAVAKK